MAGISPKTMRFRLVKLKITARALSSNRNRRSFKQQTIVQLISKQKKNTKKSQKFYL